MFTSKIQLITDLLRSWDDLWISGAGFTWTTAVMRLFGLGCSRDNTDSRLAVHIALHCGSLRRYLRDVTSVSLSKAAVCYGEWS